MQINAAGLFAGTTRETVAGSTKITKISIHLKGKMSCRHGSASRDDIPCRSAAVVHEAIISYVAKPTLPLTNYKNMSFLWFVLIGIFIGWRNWVFLPMEGVSMYASMAIGAAGAITGGLLFRVLDNSARPDLIGSVLAALVGALVLLLLVRLITKISRYYAQTRPKT